MAIICLVLPCLVVLGSFHPVQAAPFRILALGDSLTAGYGLDRADGFTIRLEAALRATGLDVVIINAGVSGDTTAGGRSRLAWALADKPDAVLVELGANDGLRGLDPAATYDNLAAILEQIKAARLPVLLTGMKAPPNLGREYGAQFDGLYLRLANEYRVAFYPFFLDGVAALPHLNQPDGIHPNPRGVEIVVARILPYVAALVVK